MARLQWRMPVSALGSVFQHNLKMEKSVMQKFVQSVRNVFVREEGATMVEYGLMVALIAVVCLLAVTALGVSVNGVFTQISTSV